MKKSKKAWRDTPASTAEQIEISMREGNTEKQTRLDAIVTNCNFIIANSTNDGLKTFAGVILRIAKGEAK